MIQLKKIISIRSPLKVSKSATSQDASIQCPSPPTLTPLDTTLSSISRCADVTQSIINKHRKLFSYPLGSIRDLRDTERWGGGLIPQLYCPFPNYIDEELIKSTQDEIKCILVNNGFESKKVDTYLKYNIGHFTNRIMQFPEVMPFELKKEAFIVSSCLYYGLYMGDDGIDIDHIHDNSREIMAKLGESCQNALMGKLNKDSLSGLPKHYADMHIRLMKLSEKTSIDLAPLYEYARYYFSANDKEVEWRFNFISKQELPLIQDYRAFRAHGSGVKFAQSITCLSMGIDPALELPSSSPIDEYNYSSHKISFELADQSAQFISAFVYDVTSLFRELKGLMLDKESSLGGVTDNLIILQYASDKRSSLMHLLHNLLSEVNQSMKCVEEKNNSLIPILKERKRNLNSKLIEKKDNFEAEKLKTEIKQLDNKLKYFEHCIINFAVGCNYWYIYDTARYNVLKKDEILIVNEDSKGRVYTEVLLENEEE